MKQATGQGLVLSEISSLALRHPGTQCHTRATRVPSGHRGRASGGNAEAEMTLSKTVLNNSNISSNRDSVINLTNGYKILMIMWLLHIVVSIFIIITLLDRRLAE